jgi:hypothetical protein
MRSETLGGSPIQLRGLIRVPRMALQPFFKQSAPLNQSVSASVEPFGWVSLACTHCEVTWRGRLGELCWSCGSIGHQPASTRIIPG